MDSSGASDEPNTADNIPTPDEPPRYEDIQPRRRPRIQKFDSAQWQGGKPNLIFMLLSSPSESSITARQNIEWVAQLHVKARDLPRLMREGFYWNLDNFCLESTYIEEKIDSGGPANVGFTCTRNYYLSDIDHGNNAQWAAKLSVYARNVGTLSRFRLPNLQLGHVALVTAIDPRCTGRKLYKFDRFHPDKNFNAIYDDMPMDGWWPWPRRAASDNQSMGQAHAENH
ncbi:hypothetical protein CkaCkLH20_02325 [Colletotrichum karsti]|uniref:Uncharacterized protein n=1 Tax=Colletotrichum karsti TaxID=1095194 RepID=A0A9P6IGU5_9PEZI|nr:uncharacterized protein CkaCkLH20_02325 [Colletotrichum karsti]KAF9880371.1 hypothetical protein CkaCkLH20_02325 [Colletotrichum karsti]